MAGKLHQLLAVMSDLRGSAEKISNEVAKNFSGKVSLFDEEEKSFTALKDEESGGARAAMLELMRMKESELSSHTSMAETVKTQLDWYAENVGPLIDAQYQIDRTNMRAAANIVLNGKTFENVPATFLLQFGKYLEKMRAVVKHLPTLDMKVKWEKDENKGEGIWRAPDEEKVRTTKETEHRVITPQDEHHPAQVEPYVNDVPVGITKIHRWSGRITPAQKADILRNVDKKIREIKQALGLANEAEHDTETIADALFEDIFSVLK